MPAATISVDVDLNNDDDYGDAGETGLPARANPGIVIRRGNDVGQRLVPPMVSTCTYELDNQDAAYSVGTAIGANDPTRVIATHAATPYELFNGRIDRVTQFPQIEKQSVGIFARGPLALFPRRRGFATTLRVAGRVDECIDDVLTALGWPTGAGSRTMDTATRSVPLFWLDPGDDPWQVLTMLLNYEGPSANLYDSGDNKIVFEAQDYRTTATHATVVQNTYRDKTTEPIFWKLLRYEDGIDRVVNDCAIAWRTLAVSTGDPQIVNTTENVQNTASTTASGTIPSGVKVGDVVVYVISANETTTQTWSVATGWTRFSAGLFNPGSLVSDVAKKRITSDSEGGSSFTVTMNESQKYVVTCIAIRGLRDVGDMSTSGIVDAEAQSNGTNSQIAQITTTEANTFMIHVGTNHVAVFSSPPAGSTEVIQSGGDEVRNAIAFEKKTSTVTNENNTYTFTGSHDAVTATIAFIYDDVDTVWSHSGQLSLTDSEVLTLTVDFPNGLPVTAAIACVEDVDYVVSSGSSLVSLTLDRTAASSITMTLTAAASGGPHVIDPITGVPDEANILGIRLRAQAYEETARGRATSSDSTSQTSFEKRGLGSYPTWPIIDQDEAQNVADAIIADYKDPRAVAQFQVTGDRTTATLTDVLEAVVSDRLRLIETRSSIDLTGFLESIEYHVGEASRTEAIFGIREV